MQVASTSSGRSVSSRALPALVLGLGLAVVLSCNHGSGEDDDGHEEAAPHGSAREAPRSIAGSSDRPEPTPLLDDVGSGMGGFALDGEAPGDQAGYSLAGIGDVNDDGVDDFIVGAHQNDAAGSSAGAVYVVFGETDFGQGPFDLGDVGGTVGGISFLGEAPFAGAGVSVDGGGDFNGDGVADFIIGVPGNDIGGGPDSGSTYIVFGNPQLAGTDVLLFYVEYGYGVGNAYGVVLWGEASGDNSGYSVANAGDVNADGFDDVIVGAPFADPNGAGSGRTYVIYGQVWPSTGWVVDLSDISQGIGGFAIDGERASDFSGLTVSSAGDTNGDGCDDILVGAPYADPNGSASGRAYVVYGGDLGPDPIQLSAIAGGVGGRAYDGEASLDSASLGFSRAGDFNLDGYDDFIIGAHGTDITTADRGRAYLVFGTPGRRLAPIQLSTIGAGQAGISFDGLATSDYTGFAVGAAGDSNQDGLDDILISAYRRDPQGLTDAGVAFLAFGGDDPDMATATTLLRTVDSWVGGFTMEGENPGDNAGYALRGIGDVNGDGVPDIGVGATSADPNGSSSGRVYVVFGDSARGAYYSGFSRKPQPGEDVYTTPQGHDIFVEAPGLLENDVDYDQDPLTIVPDTFVSSAGSSVQVFADGSLDFSPPHRLWWGEDVFEYTVEDGQGGEAEGVVRVRGIPSVVPLSLVATGKGGYAVDGAAPFDGTGQALAHAGDADGDGLADLLLGAYEADPTSLDSAGTTYVFYGRSAPKVSPLALSPRTTDAYGEAAFDWSGIAVSGAGDFNGDGLSDFLVGAIGADANGSRSGRTYVVFGNGTRPTGLLGSLDGTNGFSLEGEAVEDDSGRSIAAAGDVNGDGLDDILVSAYRADGTEIDAGRIYLIYGTDQAIGSASLELSNVGGTVAGVVLEGEGEGDFAGFALAGGVDLDNDGFDEMVIGAYAADLAGGASGRIYIVYGDDALPSALSLSDVADPMAAPDYGLAIDGELPGDFAGRSLAAAGDLDGDGVDDLLVGAPGASVAGVGTGRVYALLGGASFQPGGGTLSLADVGGTVEGAVFDGEAAQDSAGAAIASLGDLNADGYADFVIGAPFATGEAFGSGRAYVVVGRPDLGATEAVLLADVATGAGGFAIDGEYSFDAAGHAVAGGGDVDGDGYPDIVVGAHEGGPDQQGRVYVVFGGPYVPVQGVAP